MQSAKLISSSDEPMLQMAPTQDYAISWDASQQMQAAERADTQSALHAMGKLLKLFPSLCGTVP